MGNNIVIWMLKGRDDARLIPVQLEPAPANIDDATRQLPSGGYTTFRTFHGNRIMRPASHFERLEEAAQLSGKPLKVNRERITQAMHQLLTEEKQPGGAEERRVRMILDLEQDPGTIYLLLEPLHVPAAQDYERGVRTVTRQMQRSNPKAKLTSFIHTASAVRKELPQGLNEAIMIGADGRVLEGLSSNFFAVKDGVIWTAEQGVLSGITRTLVLELIHEQQLPLKLEGWRADDLKQLDEAFITSASRAVLPVVEIDGQPVGAGQPGPLTRRLLQAYLARIEAELEPV